MKIILFRNRCIACGYCVSLAPDLWVISSIDGKITMKDFPNFEDEIQTLEINAINIDEMEQSAIICPVNAIKIL